MPKKIAVKGADSYSPQPYGSQNNVYGGAPNNGFSGSQTSASQQNASAQRPSGGSTPASAFGDFSSAWGQAITPPPYVPQPAQERYYASMMSGGPPVEAQAASEAQPAGTAGGWTPKPIVNWSNASEPPDGFAPPSYTEPPSNTPLTAAPQFSGSSNSLAAEPDKTRAVEQPTDPFYQKLYEYAAAPGYEYLHDQPDLLRGYYAYVDQLRNALKAVGFNGTQADQVDIVDWLKHQGQASPDAGRRGYDTYMDIPAGPTTGFTPSGGSGGGTFTYVGDPNQGLDPAIAGLAQQYAVDDPRYGWLVQSPVAVQEYQNYANNGNNDVDIVDWLAHQSAYSNNANPLVGRRGYDTYLYKKDPTSGQLVPRDNSTAQQNAPTNAGGPTPPAPSQPALPPTVPPVVPPVAPPAPAPQAPSVPPPATTAPPPAPPLVPPVVPPAPPPAPPVAPPASVTPPSNAGSVSPDSTDPNTIFANLQKTLAPGFQYEQDQLTRAARASTAANGGYADDSGGAGANLLNAQQGLAANQGTRLSDYAATAEQKSLDRALQYYMTNTTAGTSRYEIDTNKAIADMNADVQKLGIRTNADIEQGKLDLSRYGIDKNDLLDRYKSELSLKGEMYSADKQYDAAAMQKAASSAIAAANERTQKYVADLQRLTDVGQLGQNDVNSKRNYDLGVLGINSNVYGIDQNNLLKYYQMLMQFSTPGQLGQLPFQLPGGVMNP
jgi:hypothetical protein